MLILFQIFYTIHLVASQIIVQDPTDDTFCEGSNAVLSCVTFDNSTISAADKTGWFRDTNPPIALSDSMINNTRHGDVVTSVLTIESVSLNDNGNGYFCAPSFGIGSDVAVISVAGPPGAISDVIIPPDTITACSFVVQWSRPSSDPVCSPVQYTVTVTTGGMLIITDNTTLTHYNVTGLKNNTTYHVSMTASNNAGSSSSATTSMSVMTNNNSPPKQPADLSIVVKTPTVLEAKWTAVDDCEVVHYMIIVFIEGEMTNITSNTTNMTDYTITGLCPDTTYSVSVTAISNAGSSNSSSMVVMTNGTVVAPSIAEVIIWDNTSFVVNWIMPEPNYNYTVMLNTNNKTNVIVPESTNSYNVTELNDDAIYNVRVAASCRATSTSDPVTVYAPVRQPEVAYCISYKNEFAYLELKSSVVHNESQVSQLLDFYLMYQYNGSRMNMNSKSVVCRENNCSVQFSDNVTNMDMMVELVSVEARGPFANNSLMINMNESTNAVSATLQMKTEHSAILLCKLACFSRDLTCVLTDFSMNETDYVMKIGNITCPEKDYEYPYQPINISNLASGTTYHFCVFANNTAMNRLVGKKHCGSFTTMPSESESMMWWPVVVAVFVALLIASVLVFIIVMIWCKGRKSSKKLIISTSNAASRKRSDVTVPLGDNLPFGYPRGPDDDKRTVAETQIPESLRSDGTVEDDKIQFVHPNAQNGKEWYDRLASESDRTVTSEDIGAQATTEGELSSKMLHHHVYDTDELNRDTTDIASIEPGAVIVQLGDNPTYDCPRGPGDDKRRIGAETQKEETIRNDRDTIDAASNKPIAMAVQLGDNPTYGWPRGPGYDKRRTDAETQKEESIINELYYHIDEVPGGQLEQQPPLNAATSLPTTNEAALANSSVAKKPPGKINFYDPIQKHSSAIPHLKTSSGDKYALSSKTGRASKQSDKTTTDKQKLPHYAMPDKSKKAASQKTQHTDLDVNSPASDESKGLIGQMAINTNSEIPLLPASQMISKEDGPNMYAKIA